MKKNLIILILISISNFGFSQNKKEQIEILKKSLDSLQIESDKNIKSLSEKSKILISTIDSLKVEISKKSSLIQNQTEENIDLKAKVLFVEKEKETLLSEISKIKVQLDESKKSLDQFKLKFIQYKDSLVKINSIDKNFLISKNTVGQFVIGSKIPISSDFLIEKKSKNYNPESNIDGFYYIISQNGKKLLEIEMEYNFNTNKNSDKISAIGIFSDKFKTDKGIGINSTLQEVSKKYTKNKITRQDYINQNELLTEECGIYFHLEDKGFVGINRDDGEGVMNCNLKDFKTETKIISIFVNKCTN